MKEMVHTKRESKNVEPLREGRHRLCVVATASLLLLAGCLGSPHLKIPVKEMNRRVRTLCTAPIQLEPDLGVASDHIQGYQGILMQELHRTSWEIVEPSRYAAIERRVNEQEGGYFDPVTGEADQSKRARIAEQVRSAARSELGCEATLHPSIVVVGAACANGEAIWDDTSQYVGTVWDSSVGGIPALSLWVSIRDERDTELFFGTGGIQLLVRTEAVGFSKRRFVEVPGAVLLKDARRMYDSVRAALQPFLKKRPSEGVSRYAAKLGVPKAPDSTYPKTPAATGL